MNVDRLGSVAALSFVKPLVQNRSVCALSAAPQVDSQWLSNRIKGDGAASVVVSDATGLARLGAQTVEVFVCVLGDKDLSEAAWGAMLSARTVGGVVVVVVTGDASVWAQALARRCASVERAELVVGNAAWVSPPGAVTASVSAEGGTLGSLFVCGDRPQRLVLGSVCIGPTELQPMRASSDAVSLSTDIAASLDEDRLREVEARLQQTMDDLVQAQLTAAQALAERDSLKRKLEQQKGTTPNAQDAHLMETLRDELSAIDALVSKLRTQAQSR